MAGMAPLKELISNSALGDMDKILAKDPFTAITLSIEFFKLKLKARNSIKFNLKNFSYLKKRTATTQRTMRSSTRLATTHS
jgi:hypothetical protein